MKVTIETDNNAVLVAFMVKESKSNTYLVTDTIEPNSSKEYPLHSALRIVSIEELPQ